MLLSSIFIRLETSLLQTCFKTLRLTAICNEPKRIISTSSGLGLLQMISESNIERCASKDAQDPTSVREGNKPFLTRV